MSRLEHDLKLLDRAIANTEDIEACYGTDCTEIVSCAGIPLGKRSDLTVNVYAEPSYVVAVDDAPRLIGEHDGFDLYGYGCFESTEIGFFRDMSSYADVIFAATGCKSTPRKAICSYFEGASIAVISTLKHPVLHRSPPGISAEIGWCLYRLGFQNPRKLIAICETEYLSTSALRFIESGELNLIWTDEDGGSLSEHARYGEAELSISPIAIDGDVHAIVNVPMPDAMRDGIAMDICRNSAMVRRFRFCEHSARGTSSSELDADNAVLAWEIGTCGKDVPDELLRAVGLTGSHAGRGVAGRITSTVADDSGAIERIRSDASSVGKIVNDCDKIWSSMLRSDEVHPRDLFFKESPFSVCIDLTAGKNERERCRKRLIELAEEGKETGIDRAIEAYFAGVPADDLVG